MKIKNHADYRNILIVRTDRIGDVVLTTPVIAALRRAYPTSRISIMVTPMTRELVDGNPALDEVIVDDRAGVHNGPLGFIRLVRLVRSRRYDVALIYHTKKRTNSLFFLAGIPRRIGYHNNKFGFLLTDKIADTRPRGIKHEVEYCLDLVRYMGVVVDSWKLFIPVHKDSEEWAGRFLRDNGAHDGQRLIAIHAGASCPSRRWSLDKFIELIKRVAGRHGVHVV